MTGASERNMPDGQEYERLVDMAGRARERAYVPYSHFRVGAALLAKSGMIYTGCNVENGSYTPTMCAERVAFGSAIAAGEPPGGFEAIAVVADNQSPTSPCGVCRQVMFELAPGALVIMAAAPEQRGERLVLRVEDLLPHGFSFPDV